MSRSRAIFNGHAFDRMAPGSMYERELQKLLLRYVPIIFPDHEIYLMDPLIKTHLGDCRPDVILIGQRSPTWTIIEVETDNHLPSHIAHQLGVFLQAGFDEKLRERVLADAREHMSSDWVTQALQTRPSVALMMHGSAARIAEKVGDGIYDIVEFDLYSAATPGIFMTWERIAGDLKRTEVILERIANGMQQKFWRCRFEELLGDPASNSTRFEFNGYVLEWRRDPAGAEWLFREPEASGLSEDVTKLRVFVSSDDGLILQPDV